MKQKIATLDVYFDPASDESSATGNHGAGQYFININLGNGSRAITNLKELQTVIAHELGHFVCLLTKDSTHNPAAHVWHMISGDASMLKPAERKAWELAHEIVPDLDRDVEKASLESYERQSWK